MSQTVGDLLRLGVERLPALLAARAADGAAVPERQLQLATQAALNDAASSGGRWVSVRERARRLQGWPRKGAIDIIVTDDGHDAGFVELKWGSELWNCVWDVGKMALASADLGLPTFLLAGSSNATWEARRPGTEYFSEGRWSARDLIERHRALFAIRDWGFPTRLPEEFTTRVVARQSLTVVGVPWELRLSEAACVSSVIPLSAPL